MHSSYRKRDVYFTMYVDVSILINCILAIVFAIYRLGALCILMMVSFLTWAPITIYAILKEVNKKFAVITSLFIGISTIITLLSCIIGPSPLISLPFWFRLAIAGIFTVFAVNSVFYVLRDIEIMRNMEPK